MKSEKSRIAIDSSRVIGPVNRRLFGGFVEHMGRGVYGGVYDPQHSTADDEGFRSDVIELVREHGMTVFRYSRTSSITSERNPSSSAVECWGS